MKSATSHRPLPFTAQDLLKVYRKYRASAWFRVSYLVILGFVAFALFRFLFSGSTTACLGILLIPVTVFVVPYYAGERSPKNFAVNALPVFVIALLLIAAFQTAASTDPTPIYLSQPSTAALPSALSIYNGTVRPYAAPGPGNYVFSVQVVGSPGVNMSRVRAFVNLTPIENLAAGTTVSYPMSVDTNRYNTANSTWYNRTVYLQPIIYEFNFYANDTRGNVTQTVAPLGPITAPATDYYVLWLYISSLYLLIPFSFYFIILFMFWYLARMRKMRARMIDVEAKEKAGPGEEPEAPAAEPPKEGTAGKKPAGFTCTNCGADVSEEDLKCPKCGAVFEG